jgi:hypothetical protein
MQASKPVECVEERGDMGELGKVENRQAAAFCISFRDLRAQVGSSANSELQ